MHNSEVKRKACTVGYGPYSIQHYKHLSINATITDSIFTLDEKKIMFFKVYFEAYVYA